MDRVETIRKLLNDAFTPTQLDIIDESHFHKGHAGAASGAGHFNVTIVSEQFAGQKPLARHRLVYQAVDNLMPSEIHALSIQAMTPEECSSAKA
jgi:BolA family transcriptional regulator, general stress-responsive regulator